MFKKKPEQSAKQSGSAMIRDNALILSLENSDTPVVARFDLESLAQANFIVQNYEGLFQLSLRNFAGQIQPIAQFVNKIDAHQALQHILHALVSYNNPDKKPQPQKTSIFLKAIKIILMFCGVLFLIALLYLLYLQQALQNVPVSPISASVPIMQGNTLPPQQEIPNINIPEGQALDLDQLITAPVPQSVPQSLPQSLSETQPTEIPQ
jgi:hypothetical protein